MGGIPKECACILTCLERQRFINKRLKEKKRSFSKPSLVGGAVCTMFFSARAQGEGS